MVDGTFVSPYISSLRSVNSKIVHIVYFILFFCKQAKRANINKKEELFEKYNNEPI